MLAIPFGERLEELETVRCGGDLDLDEGAVGGRRLECVLTWVVPARGQFEAGRRGEFEGHTGGRLEGVCKGVEGEGTSEGECGNYVRRSDESVSGGVGIVTTCEVAVI